MSDPLLDALSSGKPQDIKPPPVRGVQGVVETEVKNLESQNQPLAPLTPADRIQGPDDRSNREPTEAEIELGKLEAQRRTIEAGLSDYEFIPAISDPEIDPNAPADVPADPKVVAESRGQLKPKE